MLTYEDIAAWLRAKYAPWYYSDETERRRAVCRVERLLGGEDCAD